MNEKVTLEAWEVWLAHPVTRAVKELLRREREGHKEAWARAGYETSADILRATTACQVLQALIDLDYDTLQEGLSNGE